mmetsp:Transcript_11013/g.25168  ORF Transcript_11013/g.25168 Transcript_11013/m.25168 type:complete len:715 (-) Transcript_11013:54-2198(-)
MGCPSGVKASMPTTAGRAWRHAGRSPRISLCRAWSFRFLPAACVAVAFLVCRNVHGGARTFLAASSASASHSKSGLDASSLWWRHAALQRQPVQRRVARYATQLRWLSELQDAGFDADALSLLETAAQAGDLAGAESYYCEAVREGSDLSGINYTSLIVAAGSLPALKAREAVALWCSRAEAAEASFSDKGGVRAALQTVARHGNFSLLERWFERALAVEAKPGLDFLHAAIENSAQSGNLSAAYYWLAKSQMAAGRGQADIWPNQETMSILYSALTITAAADGDLDGIEFQLTEARRGPFAVSKQAWDRAVLAACAQANTSMAAEWATEASNQGAPLTCRTHGALIKAFSEAGSLSDAERWFQAMIDRGCRPVAKSFLAVLHAAGRAADLESAQLWFDRMVAEGFKATPAAYVSLLSAAARSCSLPEAERIYEEALHAGLQPTPGMHGMLIRGAGHCGDLERADTYLAAMLQRKQSLTPETFLALLIAAREKGNASLAVRWFEQAEESGADLTAQLYTTMIDALGKFQNYSLAEEYFLQAVDNSAVALEPKLLNAILKVTLMSRKPDRAEMLFYRGIKLGFQPDIRTYTTLIYDATDRRQRDRAEMWYSKLEASGLEVDIVFYNAMITAACRNGDLETATDWFHKAEARSDLDITAIFFGNIIAAAATRGELGLADQWLSKALKLGVKPDDKIREAYRKGILELQRKRSLQRS